MSKNGEAVLKKKTFDVFWRRLLSESLVPEKHKKVLYDVQKFSKAKPYTQKESIQIDKNCKILDFIETKTRFWWFF